MKRFISILLVIATLASMCTGFAGCGSSSEYVTRGEWITSLADRFGMDSTVAETDYFTDVGADSEYYAYVQSCADWGVLSNAASTQFKPDDDATVEFALETAILASEVDIGDKSVVDYAIDNGIIKDASFMSVRGRLTPEIATQIMDWTQDLYLNGIVEPREIVEFNPEIQDLTQEEAIVESEEEDGVYTVSAELAESLNSGDVLMVPDDEYEDGVGVKVDDITINEDGTATITTLEPELEELLKDLDIAAPVVWSMNDVQLSEGFSMSGAGGVSYTDGTGAYVTTLDNRTGNTMQATNLANGVIPDINLNVNFTKGTVSLNPQWDSLAGLGESFSMSATQSEYATNPKGKNSFEKTSVIPVGSAYGNDAYKNQMAINAYKDGKISLDELKKELDLTENQEEKNPKTMENKFSGGYEITGSLKISAIKMNVEAKYKLLKGLKASVTLSYQVSSSLSIKGKLSESLNFMTVRIPVTAGVTADVKFYLCLDANGSLTVTAKLSNTTKYSIDYGKVKKTSDNTADLSGTIACQIDFGPKIAIELTLAGQPLIDVGVKAVARVKASASLRYETKYVTDTNISDKTETLTITRTTYWGVGVVAYVPIISLEVNKNPKSIGNKLKLSASWTLVGEKKAKQIDILPLEEDILWQEVITLSGDNEPEETTVATEETVPDSTMNYGDFLDIDSYFLSMDEGTQASIAVTIMPHGYSMSDLMWTSSNTDVVQVSGGVVTAVGEGVATITVRTTDGKFFKQCGVNVSAASNEFVPIDDDLGKIV